MPLTPLQKAKLLKRAPNSLGMFMFMQKFEEEYKKKVNDLKEEFVKELDQLRTDVQVTFNHIKSIQKGDKGDKPMLGIDYDIYQPKDGHTPTKEELQAIIAPLIPKVKDGYTPTRNELIDLIKPLIPQMPDITAIAELVLNRISMPDTPTAEAITDMVLDKLSERKVAIADIDGLQNVLNILNRNITELKSRKLQGGGGGGMGNWQTDNFTGDGLTVAFTLSNNVASAGTAVIVLLNGQVQEQTTHYSVSGKTLTFTTAPFDGAAVHAWYSRR